MAPPARTATVSALSVGRGAQHQRDHDVETRQRHARTAGDQRSPSGSIAHKAKQLDQHNPEPSREQRGPRPEQPRQRPGDAGRDEEPAKQKRQSKPYPSRMPDIVAEHHRQQMKRRTRDRERQEPESEQMNRQHRP